MPKAPAIAICLGVKLSQDRENPRGEEASTRCLLVIRMDASQVMLRVCSGYMVLHVRTRSSVHIT